MLNNWHTMIQNKQVEQVSTLLADNVTLFSPVIHTPIQGKQMVSMYLTAAFHTFLNGSFNYDREFTADNAAVLEFSLNIDGIDINGIDMITWNEDGKITEFKVMIRPYKALNMINDQMTAMLATLQQQAMK
ncbi:nuclear transport factor 2 family protein [Colwellia sp. M166]|uniref:nuclear transport factor 2 family protein n=1 Tax=Colwellia sp. M166 TaxID=2583805 RepID=UPI00211DFF6F|nr:nuclear transport factor 2 family protein [Colwellia sp. M166]UUO23582.1 nuclear transport factor 2 family protein [Colwellia sp. M166]|tara:strand:+ start:17003 stop:17395 length:393 start_codon:yes stop_codon:yes gene_type:complete